MADKIEVTPKGEQREGEEVFTIVITRGAAMRTLEKTKSEVATILKRELLRAERLLNQLEEAASDKVDSGTMDSELASTNRLVRDIQSVLSFME